MDILRRPELMDRLAAAYALGTLRGGARRRFETLARGSPALRVAAQLWQERFMSMTELQQAETPGPNVWKRIENVLASEPAPVAPTGPGPGADLLRRALAWWRAGALAAAMAAIAAIAITLDLRGELQGRDVQLAALQAQGRDLVRRNQELVAQMQAQPEVRYVAVLMDEKAAPMLLATYDAKNDMLMVKRMASFQEGPEQSLQLWAMMPSGSPRSLGVLPPQPVMRMPAPQQVLGQSPALAISLEPKGGVPGERGPTGPVLWKGAVLQTPV